VTWLILCGFLVENRPGKALKKVTAKFRERGDAADGNTQEIHATSIMMAIEPVQVVAARLRPIPRESLEEHAKR